MQIELDVIARVLTENFSIERSAELIVAMLPPGAAKGESLMFYDAPPSDLLVETIPCPGSAPTLPSARGIL